MKTSMAKSFLAVYYDFQISKEINDWHRDPEEVKREQREYREKQKSRYAPHRKYGFVKNLKK